MTAAPRSGPLARAAAVGAVLISLVLMGAGANRAAGPTPEELLARSIARIAMGDLRSTPGPRAEDYSVAATLLTMAHELVPKDGDMLRRAIEAAHGANDEARVLELTRALLSLDSEAGDTVAQLRLITATISRNCQNAEARLAVYENYLSGAGKDRIDESIRSHLALDAALLLKELGDTKGFVAKLTQAIQLDRTHKEAALLGATYFAEKFPNDRAKSLEWLVMVLLADPMDPNVQFAMARELASAGALKAARRFHTNAMNISDAAGGADQDLVVERLVLLWYTEGPGAVVASINHDLLVEQDNAAREIRRRTEAQLPLTGAPKPEDIRLTMPIAALAVLAAKTANDEAAATSALVGMVKTVGDSILKLNDAVKQGNLVEAEAMRRSNDLIFQLESVRLWAGLQIDEVKKELEPMLAAQAQFPETAAVMSGWLKLRTGDPAGAVAALEPVADQIALARIGLGLAKEALGDKQGAIAEFQRLLRDHPLEAAGAYSRGRLQALGVSDDLPTRTAMERIADGVPSWIDHAVLQPRNYVQLRAEVLDHDLEAIDADRIRITVQNLSDVPMAFGSDRTISSRMILAPRLEDGSLNGLLDRPEVIDIARRLRLKPRERVTVTVWPDPGQSGWLMEAMSDRSFRARWRVIQGFRIDPAGGFQPGPMGLATETDAIVRRPLPESSLTAADLAARLAGDPVDSLPRLAMTLRAFLLHPAFEPAAPAKPAAGPGAAPAAAPQPPAKPAEPGPAARVPDANELKPAVDALVARYRTLPQVQRAILVAMLPHARLAPAMAPFDQAVRNDADPLVQALVLVTRVTEPDDAVLTAAAQSPDERIRSLAHDLLPRLTRKDKSYAQAKAEDLKGPTAKPKTEPPPASPSGPSAEGTR